jgi:hypothetical protein
MTIATFNPLCIETFHLDTTMRMDGVKTFNPLCIETIKSISGCVRWLSALSILFALRRKKKTIKKRDYGIAFNPLCIETPFVEGEFGLL